MFNVLTRNKNFTSQNNKMKRVENMQETLKIVFDLKRNLEL